MTKQNTGKGLAVHATSCSAWARSAPSIAAAPQQAGREGPQEAFAVLAQRSGASHGEGFYPVRHEDLHARGPRMKINQPKWKVHVPGLTNKERVACAALA